MVCQSVRRRSASAPSSASLARRAAAPLCEPVPRALRPVDQAGPGQRHLAPQAWALAALGIPPALHDDRLTLVDALADRGAAPLPGLERGVARREPAVLAEAAVDEGGIEVAIDRPHPAEPDLSAHRHRIGIEQADLEQPAVLEQARADAERGRLDRQLQAHASPGVMARTASRARAADPS